MSAAFIEQRRRALKRFLLLVVRHPILAKDDITKIFLSATGQVRQATIVIELIDCFDVSSLWGSRMWE